MDAGVLKEIAMKRSLACALLSLCLSWSAYAALDIGDAAPDFTTPAALGGKVYQFSLADSLKKGPVVLYFFPPHSPRAARSKRTNSRRPPPSSPRSAHR